MFKKFQVNTLKYNMERDMELVMSYVFCVYVRTKKSSCTVSNKNVIVKIQGMVFLRIVKWIHEWWYEIGCVSNLVICLNKTNRKGNCVVSNKIVIVKIQRMICIKMANEYMEWWYVKEILIKLVSYKHVLVFQLWNRLRIVG